MKYVFLILGVVWALQLVLSFWQLRHFHRQIAAQRVRGRCAVGMHGDRIRGRRYGVLVVDERSIVRYAGLFSGWTVFAKLRPIAGLDGLPLDTISATTTPPANLRLAQWLALQQAAQFLVQQPATPQSSSPGVVTTDQRA
jgi:DNA-binding transcriptional regulator of glucitol operon